MEPPKSRSWMVQMMFLFIMLVNVIFRVILSHEFVWGECSWHSPTKKTNQKGAIPQKILQTVDLQWWAPRPIVMVWYGTPFFMAENTLGFHWERNNWRYNHYKWPYKWGPLGVITTLTPQVPMKNEGFYTLKLWVITPQKWRYYVGFPW